jgi:hypothetical protein
LNLLQRIAGIAVGVVLFILAIIFASVLLAVAGGVALGVWVWLMWKTRKLRRQMEQEAAARGDGSVIEGEYRVEREVGRIDDDTR